MVPSGVTVKAPEIGWLGSVGVTWTRRMSSGSIRYGGSGIMRTVSINRMSGGSMMYGGNEALHNSTGNGPEFGAGASTAGVTITVGPSSTGAGPATGPSPIGILAGRRLSPGGPSAASYAPRITASSPAGAGGLALWFLPPSAGSIRGSPWRMRYENCPWHPKPASHKPRIAQHVGSSFPRPFSPIVRLLLLSPPVPAIPGTSMRSPPPGDAVPAHGAMAMGE